MSVSPVVVWGLLLDVLIMRLPTNSAGDSSLPATVNLDSSNLDLDRTRHPPWISRAVALRHRLP